MEITNLNKRLSSLNSKSEDIKHEKKMLLDDYNDLLHQVRKLGIISAASFFTWAVILQAFSHSKSPTVKALGGFLTPWCIIVFLVAFIPLLIKGYDSFINADNQYAKKFARKLDKLTLADRIDNLNMDIARLDSEMEKIKEDILSQGGEIQLTEQSRIRKAISRKIRKRILSQKRISASLSQQQLLHKFLKQNQIRRMKRMLSKRHRSRRMSWKKKSVFLMMNR